jgi:hypothetical protein
VSEQLNELKPNRMATAESISLTGNIDDIQTVTKAKVESGELSWYQNIVVG